MKPKTTESDRFTASPRHRVTAFSWQGWNLELPSRWNPIKLEGTYETGQVLIADMHRPQLGIRWSTVAKKRFDSEAWAERALRDEVGKLASAKGKPLRMPAGDWEGSTIFLEPEPPGRDVWVGYSPTSKRVIEIVHHVHRRDRVLTDAILPALSDSPEGKPRAWSIFDLSCIVPATYELTTHRLNAGDLTLTFADKRKLLIVRQIALAEMALKRMPIEKWLADQERATNRHYASSAPIEETTIATHSGIRRVSTRRLRFGFMRSLPKSLVTLTLHDRERDRLAILQGAEEADIRQVAESLMNP